MNQFQPEGAVSSVPAVVFANPKGGVGKSTLAFLASVYLASRGIRICFIDCDPQGTGEACIARFVDGKMITTPHQQPRADTHQEAPVNTAGSQKAIDQLSRTAVDLLVIDTAAGIRPSELTFLRAADLVVVPTSTSDLDLAATRRFIQNIGRQGAGVAHRDTTSVPASNGGHGQRPQGVAAHLIVVPNQARDEADMQHIRSAIPEAHVLKPVYYTAGIQRALHASRDEAEVLEALRGSQPFFRQLETWANRARQAHARTTDPR